MRNLRGEEGLFCNIAAYVHNVNAHHTMEMLSNPDLPNLIQPVLPQSFTATTRARSPLRSTPIGFGLRLDGAGCSPNDTSTRWKKERCWPSAGRGCVFGLLYWGPTRLAGPVGSSGSMLKTSSSCPRVGNGVSRDLRNEHHTRSSDSLYYCHGILGLLSIKPLCTTLVPAVLTPRCCGLPYVIERKVRVTDEAVVYGGLLKHWPQGYWVLMTCWNATKGSE